MSELAEDVVARRLAAMAALSRRFLESPDGKAWMRREARQARLAAVVDMSPASIDARIRRLSALRRLCLSLREAGESAGAAGAASQTGPGQSSRR